MIHIGISKEHQIDTLRHHDAMEKMHTSEKAKYWFHRKPYAAFDLKRGDAGGQENIESVSCINERDSQN